MTLSLKALLSNLFSRKLVYNFVLQPPEEEDETTAEED